jgi:hypothetical protein
MRLFPRESPSGRLSGEIFLRFSFYPEKLNKYNTINVVYANAYFFTSLTRLSEIHVNTYGMPRISECLADDVFLDFFEKLHIW